MAHHNKPLRYEPTPEPSDELRNAMRIGAKSVEQLIEAQKRHLDGLAPHVHPLVWKEALKAADGDVSRIAVHSYTEVYVLNGRDKLPGSLVEHLDETA